MYIKIPIIEREINETTGEIETKKEYINVLLDTTIKAHYKWECEFQPVLGVAFTEYYEKIKNDNINNKIDLISFLKLLYCMIEHPKITTFKEFLGIFNIENSEEIITIISDTLKAITTSSANKKKLLNV